MEGKWKWESDSKVGMGLVNRGGLLACCVEANILMSCLAAVFPVEMRVLKCFPSLLF